MKKFLIVFIINIIMIELSIQQDLKNETSNSITPTNSTKSKIGTPGGYYYNK